MLIDTHVHLDADFPEIRREKIKRAREAGVVGFVAIGANPNTWECNSQLAEEHGQFYAVGLHPQLASEGYTWGRETEQMLDRMRQDSRLVAIGEIGLDATYGDLEGQREVFNEHLRYASAYAYPVCIHTREAFVPTMEMLDAHALSGIVLHCFTGTKDMARSALDRGCYISFSGIVTFKSAGYLREVAAYIPQESMLVETDSPFLAPHPFRGKTNEPSFMVHTARVLAETRGVPLHVLEGHLWENSAKAFPLARFSPLEA